MARQGITTRVVQPGRTRPGKADAAKDLPQDEPKPKLPPNLFRPQYKDKKTGQRKYQKMIWYRFSVGGHLYRGSTGCRDVRNAKVKAAEVYYNLDAQNGGLERKPRLTIESALDGFAVHLSLGKGAGRQQSDQMRVLREVLHPSRVRFIEELGEGVYAAWMKSDRAFTVENGTKSPEVKPAAKLKPRSRNERIMVLKRFGQWLLASRKLTYNPFAILQTEDPNAAAKRERYAQWPHQTEHLLRMVRLRPLLRGATTLQTLILFRRMGRVRSLIYRTVSQTGLRRREARLICVKHVDLDRGRIDLPPEIAKSKRDQYVLVNSDLARRLAAYIRSLGPVDPQSPLFPPVTTHRGSHAPKTAVPRMTTFDKDLEYAGIPKLDDRGRVADFHGLRMTYITHLRLAGVTLDMAQRLARHSDRELTEKIYTDYDLLSDQEREAAEMLVPEHRRKRYVMRDEA